MQWHRLLKNIILFEIIHVCIIIDLNVQVKWIFQDGRKMIERHVARLYGLYYMSRYMGETWNAIDTVEIIGLKYKSEV